MRAYLRLGGLADERGHGVGVAGQRVHVGLGAHVPHARGGVAPGRQQHVDGGVQLHRVHGRQVPVVVPDHLNGIILNTDKLRTSFF